jgi:hypothetical protein
VKGFTTETQRTQRFGVRRGASTCCDSLRSGSQIERNASGLDLSADLLLSSHSRQKCAISETNRPHVDTSGADSSK